ncbi:unnamed protein product [Euphydryas editha]|uniref:Uncharacterized protein n=1 Tax=Euphydryas editha TaxID=104508 RepID=A0AAU9UYH4_EUPED|nr:unnamed protein product [Euphydryas editha]
MEKNEVRVVIKYLCLKKMSTKEIYGDLETLGDSALPYFTVSGGVRSSNWAERRLKTNIAPSVHPHLAPRIISEKSNKSC